MVAVEIDPDLASALRVEYAGANVTIHTADVLKVEPCGRNEFGNVVMRVRDTGHGLNDNELAAAMEPFRTQAPSDKATDSAGISLSLTKALVEANRAQFQIKTAPHSGTLIEVVFARAAARA